MNEDTTPSEPALAGLRAKLAGKQGPEFWRSLEEIAGTADFEKWVGDEFPERATLLQIDRRKFIHLMGASVALAGLSGCHFRLGAQPKLIPYVKQPEEIVQGNPLAFASAVSLAGYGVGILVESREGRPIKIEGNPDHPASLGRMKPFLQASLLNLYDPDRSQNVLDRGEISTWDSFITVARQAMAREEASGGAGLRVLTENVTSPTLGAQIGALLTQFPQARWHQYEPVHRDNVHAGAQLAFGRPVNTVYRFDRADVIVSLDADFLQTMPGNLRYAWDFGEKRRVRKNKTTMNRLYVAETTHTVTGAMADHRLPLKPSQVEALARGLQTGAAPAGLDVPWFEALLSDLQSNAGRSVVVVGDEQPAVVHALGHAINASLGNIGQTVLYTNPVEVRPESHVESITTLAGDIRAGRVKTLLMLGGNPAYSAPADLEFDKLLADDKLVPLRVHLAPFVDETSRLCHWHLPESHFLESWSDTRAFDGTVSLVQPLIAPLYEGRSAHEVLSIWEGRARAGIDLVRENWQQTTGLRDLAFEKFWERSLNTGLVAGSALAPLSLTPRADVAATTAAAAATNGLEISFRPDPHVWDQRYSNNGWLQELPKPLTRLSWDNAAFVSPRTAESLGVTNDDFEGFNGDMVALTHAQRTVSAPVWVLPGQPDGVVTVHLGFGRTSVGEVGNGVGFRAEALRTTGAQWAGGGVTARKLGARHQFASVQHHHSMEGREIVKVATLDEFRKKYGQVATEAGREETAEGNQALQNPGDEVRRQDGVDQGAQGEREEGGRHDLTLYNDAEFAYDGYKWGMVIDLNVCIGCNACSLACQAENNIPVVGRNEVRRGREMNWIRVDRYYEGTSLDNPDTVFQPVPCMHCENAPCEPVCPVAATVHSHEGLNQMIYNRCIGTKYCSNNCPYKVRRFNFLKYTAGSAGPGTTNFDLPVMQMATNPEVTVRGRGVMEKCSYCVQRINRVRIATKTQGRLIKDGEVITACQQACPTDAIIFGNVGDKDARVTALKYEPHNYSLLNELNTKPRTTYLAKLRNPHPDFATEKESSHGSNPFPQ